MAWNDEKKAAVIEEYKRIMAEDFDTDEQRAGVTVEVVKQLADQFGETANGVRMVLQKADVYIKAANTRTTSKSSGEGAKRVNKAEAIQSLKNSISAVDPALVDDDILDKLTGKAAAYLVGVITAATK